MQPILIYKLLLVDNITCPVNIYSKILEKVMANKLMNYMESNNLFYQHQYGFRPKHSTIHPIIHLLNQIAEEN